MTLAPYIEHGLKDRRLGDPKPDFSRSRSDVDSLNESYLCSTEDAYVPGQIHPGRPGMIIDAVRGTIDYRDLSYILALTSLGSLDNSKPTKIISRSSKRTLDAGWDEQQIEYLTWHAAWKPCFAFAATDIVHCDSHGYAVDQRVFFRGLTGGAGITAASSSALGTVYYVVDPTPHTFKLSATAGGAVLDITTDMTAGTVCAAEFVKGAIHPEWPYMYLVDIETSDQYTDWKRARAGYKGLMETKPYKRAITCNGQSMSSSELLTVTFTDGFTSKWGEVQLPKIVCTDSYLTTTAPATDQIPYSQGEGATPPNAPSIRSVVISAGVDQLTYHWPNGWSRLSESTPDAIPFAGVYLTQRVTEYVWPITFK